MNGFVEIIVKTGDYLLGWLLYLPRDLRLLMLAVLTTFLMSVFKRFVTDTQWLERARNDLKVLNGLIRQARAAEKRPDLDRLRYTRALIQLRRLRAEFRALVVVIVPLLIIGAWAWHRMEYRVPSAGEVVEVIVMAPAASIGEPVYLVPTEGVSSDGWVKVIASSGDTELPGRASWSLVTGGGESRPLLFRTGSLTLEQGIKTGGRHYQSPSFTVHDGGWRTELVMEEIKLFGKVPGIERFDSPPWVTAYLILTMLLLPVSRRLLKVG